MGLRDRAHDRQPEPRPATGVLAVAAVEPLEDLSLELGRKAVAVVGDVDLDALGRAAGREPDLAAAVTQRVVDQVPERLARAKRVDGDPLALGRLDSNLAILPAGPIGEAVTGALQELAHVDLLR